LKWNASQLASPPASQWRRQAAEKNEGPETPKTENRKLKLHDQVKDCIPSPSCGDSVASISPGNLVWSAKTGSHLEGRHRFLARDHHLELGIIVWPGPKVRGLSSMAVKEEPHDMGGAEPGAGEGSGGGAGAGAGGVALGHNNFEHCFHFIPCRSWGGLSCYFAILVLKLKADPQRERAERSSL